jgi:hypothetical protein
MASEVEATLVGSTTQVMELLACSIIAFVVLHMYIFPFSFFLFNYFSY